MADGLVSQNFVRRNLKKKGAYRQKQKDPRFQRKTRGDGGKHWEGSDSEGEGEGDEAGPREPKARVQQARGGLAGMGLDPLQLSLDSLAAAAKAPAPASRIAPSAAAAPAAAPAVGGKPAKAKARAKRGGGLTDAVLEEHAPLCPGHQFSAKLLVVKKAGPNKGRRFYGCSYSAEQRCKFFLWAEDNPALVALALQEAGEQGLQGGGGEAEQRGKLRAYALRLEGMDAAGLRDEARRFQRRRALGGASGGTDKMTLSGKRADLVKRLLAEAGAVLGVGAGERAAEGAGEGAGLEEPNSDEDEGGSKAEEGAKPRAQKKAKAAAPSAKTTRVGKTRAPRAAPKAAPPAMERARRGQAASRPAPEDEGADGEDDGEEDLDAADGATVGSADDDDDDEDEEGEEDEDEDDEEEEEEDEDSDDAFGPRRRVSRKSTSTTSSSSSSRSRSRLLPAPPSDGPERGQDPILDALRGVFGHASPRPGQLWAMQVRHS